VRRALLGVVVHGRLEAAAEALPLLHQRQRQRARVGRRVGALPLGRARVDQAELGVAHARALDHVLRSMRFSGTLSVA